MTDQRSDPVFDDLPLDGAPPRPPARKSPWDPSSKRRSRTFGFAAAVAQFKHSIEVGEGTYDLFAYYAESLRHLGRTDEAIDWSYKALSVVPRLVDVRGSLAKLLVVRHRPYEALSLLESFDADAVATGHPEYFGGQRISIESSLASGGVVDASTAAASAPPASPESATQQIALDSLRVGPFELHDVPAVTCPQCVSLLGQSALTHFDLQSSRTQGVEFLTLKPRQGG